MPYQVGKSGLVEKIAEAAKDKRIEGIADIRDESNREGVRVVIDLKRDATPEVVLNQLWRNTPAQSNFPANMLAIRGGRPETLNLKDIIESFVRFREEAITRRSTSPLRSSRRRHCVSAFCVTPSRRRRTALKRCGPPSSTVRIIIDHLSAIWSNRMRLGQSAAKR